jgi:hypothetical protein
MSQQSLNMAVSGAKGTLVLGGSTYLVDPITDTIFGTIGKWLRKRMKNPLAAIADDLKHLPKHLQEVAVKEAVALKAGGGAEMTRAYLEQQLFEPEPCAFLVWLLIRGNHADVTHEFLIPLVTEASPERVLSELYSAAGLDDMEKNRTGRPG